MTRVYRVGHKGKPVVIRKVTKVARDGRAKIARDRKAMIQIERVKAQTAKPCNYYKCKEIFKAGQQGGMIAVGTEFARLSSPLYTKRMGSQYIPDARDYHFQCLPPEARPLLRFFFPDGIPFPETPIT